MKPTKKLKLKNNWKNRLQLLLVIISKVNANRSLTYGCIIGTTGTDPIVLVHVFKTAGNIIVYVREVRIANMRVACSYFSFLGSVQAFYHSNHNHDLDSTKRIYVNNKNATVQISRHIQFSHIKTFFAL